MKRNIVIGAVAHVDSGKTTLSESILYESGAIRTKGRVDNGDSFFDTNQIERRRGITIFSKQTSFTLGEQEFCFVDTPGHMDFSGEMERSVGILDYAILVISAVDGIEPHTVELWRLLETKKIPVFIFLNKTDRDIADVNAVMMQIKKRFGDMCVCCPSFATEEDTVVAVQKGMLELALQEDKTKLTLREDKLDFALQGNAVKEQNENVLEYYLHQENWLEEIAATSEERMEYYLDGEVAPDKWLESIQQGIARREIVLCFAGSALNGNGVRAFLQGLQMCTNSMCVDEVRNRVRKPLQSQVKNQVKNQAQNQEQEQKQEQEQNQAQNQNEFQNQVHENEFGAKVYKILHDEKKERITFLKVTGGTLEVKQFLGEEKVHQIRKYQGDKYQLLECAVAGDVVGVTGLSSSYTGQGYGCEESEKSSAYHPVLKAKLIYPDTIDGKHMMEKLRLLEEEEPSLQIQWQEATQEIHVQIAGQVQMDIIKEQIAERFGIQVEFGTCQILYKETIAGPVYGMGHFEPLRHYAEAHIRLEPLPAGSGIQYEKQCPHDMLDKNYQSLIMTHMQEKVHKGVLTGSPLTDVRMVLKAGRAHLKHTEGGDFREATYRAIRQGLEQALEQERAVLLEPYVEFELNVPCDEMGRAMSDITRMHGEFHKPIVDGDMVMLTGSGPVSEMLEYGMEVVHYTKGQGSFYTKPKGYYPCHNTQEVIEQIGYDKDADLENTSSSVFCSHGAGFVVKWDEVKRYMHVEQNL